MESTVMQSRLEIADHAPKSEPSKDILIDGKIVGDATLGVDTWGKPVWHAVLRMHDDRFLSPELVQGHGSTIEDAIDDGIAKARATRDAYVERLAELESKLGTLEKSDNELRNAI